MSPADAFPVAMIALNVFGTLAVSAGSASPVGQCPAGTR